jgi:hypothetical protein
VRSIAIYVEGGGDTVQQKAELRTGFDELLKSQKNAARARRLGWKLVPSGGRGQTYNAFINALQHADQDALVVLLVDSEAPLPPEIDGEDQQNSLDRRKHLTERDSWELKKTPPQQIHLMVQCMEAWIVSDPETLAAYYGKNFQKNCLPVRANLEDEPKVAIYDKLQ